MPRQKEQAIADDIRHYNSVAIALTFILLVFCKGAPLIVDVDLKATVFVITAHSLTIRKFVEQSVAILVHLFFKLTLFKQVNVIGPKVNAT